ncbi:lipopolysaccharide biosynthesis protein [Betaproteobacteria bacterium PRO7]|jgi:O-antigen/teichoic acid export membrane protein|nr:lipopolysaccharide biosynthesis protein [Betaproteobacteria bacterium PRO7]
MKGKIVAGASWVFTFRLAERALGLVSTIVLARLLVPDDFGVVAMATAVIAVIELATAFGFELALVQHPAPERRHYDTAWTLNVVVALIGAATVAALASPMAAFFHEPRVTMIMLFLAGTAVIGGFENVGTVDFRRRMDFVREFMFMGGKRLFGFAVTMIGAVMFESYWALLVGVLASRVAGVLLSNAMQPFRPRLSLSAARELFRFSGWTLVSNLITAGLQRGPQFAVGRGGGSEALGLYVVAADVGAMPTTELAAPMNRAAIPGYARLVHDRAALKETFLDIGGLVAVVAIPAGLGLASVAEPAVQALVGDKWLGAVPLIQLLAVSGVFVACGSNLGSLFVALGRPRVNSSFLGLRLAVLLVALAAFVPHWGALGAAWAELTGAAASFAYAAWVTRQQADVSLRQLLGRMWRPALAGGAMFASVSATLVATAGLPSLARLGVGVCVGVGTFVAGLALLWWVCGRAPGTETIILRKIKVIVAQRRRTPSGEAP